MNEASRRSLLLALACVAGCASAPRHRAATARPAVISPPRAISIELADLEAFKAASPRRYDKATLSDAINGAAELFEAYGFMQLVVREYRGADTEINAQLYDQGRAINAFGIFWRERFDGAKTLAVGAEGAFAAPALCSAYGGRFYLKLVAQKGELSELQCAALLAKLVAGLPGAGERPAELRLLPAAGQEAQTLRYTSESFMGLRELTSCLHARYAGPEKKGHVRFVIVPRPGQSNADAWRDLARGFVRAGDLLKKAVPYRGDVVLGRGRGGLIFGVAEAGDFARTKAMLLELLGKER